MPKRTVTPSFESEDSELREQLVAELVESGSSEKVARKQISENHFRLVLLAERYEIPISTPNFFFKLALALARKLHPARRKIGRKSKWNDLNKAALVVEIERLTKKNDPSHGVSWAAKQLAKRQPWKDFLESKDSSQTSPDPAEALRAKYFAFRNHEWAGLAREAFSHYEREGNVQPWNDHVAAVVKKLDSN